MTQHGKEIVAKQLAQWRKEYEGLMEEDFVAWGIRYIQEHPPK